MPKKIGRAALVREARESVAHETAELARIEAATKDREKRYAIVAKKIEKARQPAVRKRNNGDVELRNVYHLAPESGWNQPTLDLGSPKMVKVAIERIVKGEIKVADGTYGSAPSTAPRLAKSYRTMNPGDTRALARLDRLLARYTKERNELIAGAFDTGLEFTPEGLARAAIANAQLRTESNHTQPEHYDPREAVARRLELAKQHLAGVRAAGLDCPCQGCDSRRAREAYQREEAAKLDAHLATMPKATVKRCGCGKGHRVPIDRQREWVKDLDGRDLWRNNAPVFYCPTDGKRYVHAAILAAELQTERKAKAKAEREADKKAAHRTRDVLAAGGIVFRCPSCEADQAAPVDDGSDPESGEDVRYVRCPDCHEEWNIDNIRIIKRGKAPTLGLVEQKEAA